MPRHDLWQGSEFSVTTQIGCSSIWALCVKSCELHAIGCKIIEPRFTRSGVRNYLCSSVVAVLTVNATSRGVRPVRLLGSSTVSMLTFWLVRPLGEFAQYDSRGVRQLQSGHFFIGAPPSGSLKVSVYVFLGTVLTDAAIVGLSTLSFESCCSNLWIRS